MTVKSLDAGTFSLPLSPVLGKSIPSLSSASWTLLLGDFSYGLSIQLFILAIRNLGAARTSAFFGTAPFVGAALSVVLLKEIPQGLFWLSLPVMLVGAWLMLSEQHEHAHDTDIPLVNDPHAHPHTHKALAHDHEHTPDLHHRHVHKTMADAG